MGLSKYPDVIRVNILRVSPMWWALNGELPMSYGTLTIGCEAGVSIDLISQMREPGPQWGQQVAQGSTAGK